MNEVKCQAHYAGDGIISCDRSIESMVQGIEFEGSAGNVLCHKWQTAAEYLWRWPWKGGVEDLRKCRESIDIMLDEIEARGGFRAGR